jgi:hypothetical protein
LGVLGDITSWAFNTDMSNVYWLYGRAGCGKSALARTIANYFLEQRRLAAFISFDRRGKEENNDPMRLVPTLAFLLSLYEKAIRDEVMIASDANVNAQGMTLESQFRELIVRPLHSANAVLQGPVVIVIDALDECGSEEPSSKYYRKHFLQQLTKALPSFPPGIRVLITSRPVPDIKNEFQNINRIHMKELEVTPDDSDISIFVRQRISEISCDDLSDHWPPSPERIAILVERAEGLFIWAATACDFIQGYDPEQSFNDLVDGKETISLSDLYSKALDSSCGRDWPKATFLKHYQAIFGLILAVKKPISPNTIDIFLQEQKIKSFKLISRLGSVLHFRENDDHEPVHVLHVSFREYLSDGNESSNRWHISIVVHNQRLAERCLQILDATFGENFCRLTPDMARTDQKLDQVETYASVYWSAHICEMKACPPGFDKRLSQWLYRHLLHWLEAMSMLEKSRRASALLNQLLGWTKVSRICN